MTLNKEMTDGRRKGAAKLEPCEWKLSCTVLLANSFNPATVEGLMCGTTLSVGWMDEVHERSCSWRVKKSEPLYVGCYELLMESARTGAVQDASRRRKRRKIGSTRVRFLAVAAAPGQATESIC